MTDETKEPELSNRFRVLAHIEETDQDGECVRCYDDPVELREFSTLEQAQQHVGMWRK